MNLPTGLNAILRTPLLTAIVPMNVSFAREVGGDFESPRGESTDGATVPLVAGTVVAGVPSIAARDGAPARLTAQSHDRVMAKTVATNASAGICQRRFEVSGNNFKSSATSWSQRLFVSS